MTLKNAFEVYSDGHAEVQTQGTTDNSVVLMKLFNTNTILSTIVADKYDRLIDIPHPRDS